MIWGGCNPSNPSPRSVHGLVIANARRDAVIASARTIVPRPTLFSSNNSQDYGYSNLNKGTFPKYHSTGLSSCITYFKTDQGLQSGNRNKIFAAYSPPEVETGATTRSVDFHTAVHYVEVITQGLNVTGKSDRWRINIKELEERVGGCPPKHYLTTYL